MKENVSTSIDQFIPEISNDNLCKFGVQEDPGKANNKPVEIEDVSYLRAAIDASSDRLFLSHLIGNAERGQIWTDIHGNQRLIVWVVAPGSVTYISKNKVYLQTLDGFKSDVGLPSIVAKAGRSAKGMVLLAEIELAFIKGAISSSSLVSFAILTGLSIIQFVLKNKKDFPKWNKGMEGVLHSHIILYLYAPTLHSVILRFVLKEIAKLLMYAPYKTASDEKAIAHIFGIITGTVSKQYLATSATILKSIIKLVLSITKEVSKPLPEVIEVNYSQPDKLVQSLRDLGVEISSNDARKIMDEYKTNPIAINLAFTRLVQGLELLSC